MFIRLERLYFNQMVSLNALGVMGFRLHKAYSQLSVSLNVYSAREQVGQFLVFVSFKGSVLLKETTATVRWLPHNFPGILQHPKINHAIANFITAPIFWH